jgi:hypothetical protein
MSAQHTPGPIQPLYYVRHPDGSYSVAQPHPTPEQVARQDGTYALCDGEHGGSVCADPYCHRGVQCVNAHDELVALMSDLRQLASEAGDHTPQSFQRGVIRLANRAAAIAKALGEQA